MSEKTWPNLGISTKPKKSNTMWGPSVTFLVDEILGIHVWSAMVSWYADMYDLDSYDQILVGEGKEYSFDQCMKKVKDFLEYDLGYAPY